jgi:hypothetical protein
MNNFLRRFGMQFSEKFGFRFLLIIVVFVLIFFWLSTPQLVVFFSGEGPKGAGEYGDMFGSVNALFTGLALCALVYGLIVQREEVALLRAELSVSRGIADKQVKTLSEQAEFIRKKATEDRLIKMIDSLKSIRSDMWSGRGDNRLGGIEAIGEILIDVGRLVKSSKLYSTGSITNSRFGVDRFDFYKSAFIHVKERSLNPIGSYLGMFEMSIHEVGINFELQDEGRRDLFAFNLLTQSLSKSDHQLISVGALAYLFHQQTVDLLIKNEFLTAERPPFDDMGDEWNNFLEINRTILEINRTILEMNRTS